jgi:hypothetical protein
MLSSPVGAEPIQQVSIRSLGGRVEPGRASDLLRQSFLGFNRMPVWTGTERVEIQGQRAITRFVVVPDRGIRLETWLDASEIPPREPDRVYVRDRDQALSCPPRTSVCRRVRGARPLEPWFWPRGWAFRGEGGWKGGSVREATAVEPGQFELIWPLGGDAPSLPAFSGAGWSSPPRARRVRVLVTEAGAPVQFEALDARSRPLWSRSLTIEGGEVIPSGALDVRPPPGRTVTEARERPQKSSLESLRFNPLSSDSR